MFRAVKKMRFWPLGVSMQVAASNHLEVLLSKAVVLSVKEKVKQRLYQMGVMEMNESKSLKTPRKAQIAIKTEKDALSRMSLEVTCLLTRR